MGKQLLICGTIMFWSLGAAQPGVGDLKYVDGEFDTDNLLDADGAGAIVITGEENFSKAVPGSGTKSPHALVVTAQLGGRPIKAAIDTREAEDKLPNVLRIDFEGKGRFDDKAAIPLSLEGVGEGYAANGSATLKVERNGRQVPVQTMVYYSRPNQKTRFFSVELQTMAEGDCFFGKKVHKVRFMDAGGNLDFQKPAGSLIQSEQPLPANSVGTMRIDTGDGPPGRNTIKAFIGQPVLVDGAWYNVVADTQAMKVTAQKIEAPAGKIHVPHGRWEAVLVGKNNMLNLNGGQEPINIPPDTYIVKIYTEYGPNSKNESSGASFQSGMSDTTQIYLVSAGTITELPIGSPLTASVTANIGDEYKQEGVCRFSLKLTDSYGAEVNNLLGANGKRPPAPKFKVLNAKGEQVYAATMGYG